MWGGAGMGRGGSKRCKPIPAPPHGTGLKSHPIPAPPPLRGRENPHGAKRGGAGQAGRGKIAIPPQQMTLHLPQFFTCRVVSFDPFGVTDPHRPLLFFFFLSNQDL